MAHRIAAHITLVHDSLDDDVIRSGLELLAAGPQLMVQRSVPAAPALTRASLIGQSVRVRDCKRDALEHLEAS